MRIYFRDAHLPLSAGIYILDSKCQYPKSAEINVGEIAPLFSVPKLSFLGIKGWLQIPPPGVGGGPFAFSHLPFYPSEFPRCLSVATPPSQHTPSSPAHTLPTLPRGGCRACLVPKLFLLRKTQEHTTVGISFKYSGSNSSFSESALTVCGARGKKPTCQCRKHESLIPASGISPGEGNGDPVLLPRKSLGRRSLVGYGPWDCKESDTTERLHFLSLLNDLACT